MILPTILSVLLLAILNYTSVASSSLEICSPINVEYTLFTLCPFASVTSFYEGDQYGYSSFSIKDRNIMSCDNTSQIWATYHDIHAKLCVDIDNDPTYRLLNPKDSEKGLIITYPAVTIPGKTNSTYEFSINLTCQMNYTETSNTKFYINTSHSTVVGQQFTLISMRASSRYGCPLYSTDKFMNFVVENRVLFGSLLWAASIPTTFFGLFLFKPTIFIVTLEMVTEVAAELSFDLTNFETEKSVLWMIFSGSLLVGLIVCYFAVTKPRFGRFVVGCTFGIVTGFLLYTAIVLPFVTVESGTAPLYLIVMLAGSFGGVAAVHVFENFFIISTAMVGAFTAIRPVAYFIGGFPMQIDVANGVEGFSYMSYLYIACIVVLSLLGMLVQFKMKPKPRKMSTILFEASFENGTSRLLPESLKLDVSVKKQAKQDDELSFDAVET